MRSSITLTIGAALGALLFGAPALGEDALEADPAAPQVATEEPGLEPVPPASADGMPADEAVVGMPEPAEMPPAAPDAMAAEPMEAMPPAPAPEADPWATGEAMPDAAMPAPDAMTMPLEDPALAPAAEALAPVEREMQAAVEGTPAVDPTSDEALAALSKLGGIGYDSQGRQGRIHVVARGDTLWDISNAYLGTPWVWPSIWNDNGEIDDPHVIHPGDRIWITDSEMRIVSAEEAAALLAGEPPAEAPAPAAPAFDEPDEVAVVPAAPTASARIDKQLVSSLDSVGLVTTEVMEAAASVVDSELEKVMLSQGDRIYIGLGAGDTRKGDQFTVFRKRERVFDPDTGRLIGWHVDVLGWVSVLEVGEEASLVKIEVSHGEIERGDRVMPREEVPTEIAVLPSPGDVEGRVSFFSQSRTMMGAVDYVYLNRGTLDGVEVGSPLQVYREGEDAIEVARRTRVRVPDRVIADLLVVRAEDNSSVAFVTHAATELELGDRFRGATTPGE